MADLLDLLKTDNLDSIGEDFDFADKGSSNSSFRKKSDQTQIGESRKKVVFKEHDDDPLAGLPDDDYFLQNSKNKGKTSFMDELLGMKSDADLNKDNQAVQEKSVMKATDQILEEDKLMDLKREPIKRQNSDNDSLKAAESSLSVKQKSINEKSKKSSLMRDLFGNSSPSKDPYRSSGKSSLENPSGKSIFSLDTVEQTSSLPSGYAPTISGSREPRRRRGSALATSDPLGLFLTSHDSEQNTDNQMQAKRVIRNPEVTKSIDHTTQPFLQASSEISTRDNLPEWLGGKGWNESNVMKKTDQAPKSEINVVEKTEKQEKLLVDDHLKTSMNKNENYPENLSILMSSQFEQQSAIIAMQQQEHELKTATVLSRQNDQLNNLLNDQKSILNQQEKQFSNLIKKQVERQALLETQMKAQQARIDQHIQTLMAQPMLTTHPGRRIQEHSDEHPQESESIIQKLQLEKSYLENTLESLRAKHEKEISILEESHSKQLSFLEETMEKLDKRMRYETEILEANYETKIEKLREEKQQMETMYKEDIENLKKSHAKFIDSIHEQHARSIELLRKEYLEVFEHISQMKHLEKEITSNITSHRTDIENMLDKTKTIIDSINTINEKLQDKHEQFTETKENILKRHEEYLESMFVDI
ncbi:putative leucine-rich repeat-containing protein DDB_G0290503 [Prorops nasuta]|uniref:putative leucine-rich repeat-containing protein DDB_G0290503 n=1 Tax=Prorops nasuta TaxID=863751 RepID=UPI0034CD41F0